MSITINSLMQQRRDTASNWSSANPTLLNGELGYETDTGKWKVGNGSAVWAALAYTPWSQINAYPITTVNIADNAITAAKIADDAVTAAKIANTSVSAGSYTTADITVDAQGRITSAASGTIGTAGLADGAVTTAKLADDAVTGAKLANDITIANNLTVTNDLTVNGTTTTIDSTTLVVEDKNIEIGKVSTPTDVTADGGGITLKGATDKTLTWVDSTDCWTFNQGLNLTAGTAGAPALVFNGDVNSGLFQPGADSLAIATAGAQRITVDSSGRVGIGTSTSDGTLHVHTASAGTVTAWANADDLIIENNNNTGISILAADNKQANIIFGSPTDNIGSIIRWQQSTNELQVGTHQTGGFLTFKTAIGSERMRIENSGKVGIGTSTPLEKLDVRGDILIRSNTPNFKLQSANGSNPYYLAANISDVVDGGVQIGKGSDLNTGTSLLTLLPNGNVGIGSTTPGHNLEIKGSFPDFAIVDSDTTNDKFRILHNGGGTQLLVDPNNVGPNASYFLVGIDGSERMRIDSSGRLLVGTSSSAQSSTAVFQANSGASTSYGVIKLARGNNSPGNNYRIGSLEFTDNNHQSAAAIDAQRDGGTWTSGSSHPTRLVFSTTANGASSPTERLQIDSSGDAIFTGTISDSIGPLRRLGYRQSISGFTLAASDVGKLIKMTSNNTLTIPSGVFVAGDMISIFNISTGSMTINASAVTLYNTADAATGNRTIGAKGLVTIVCTAGNEFAISGSQLT